VQLFPQQTKRESLSALATEVGRLLLAGQFSDLAAKFGYAIALGRSSASAIQDDLANALAELGGSDLVLDAQPKVQVTYMEPSKQLHAVAECRLATANGKAVLVELVVSEASGKFHATLEQISAAA
jgi:hypothetical protein